MADVRDSTLTMVRTECCEGYKEFGRRCSICPKRPENREAVLEYRRESMTGLGCNLNATGTGVGTSANAAHKVCAPRQLTGVGARDSAMASAIFLP
jgi:hypothetical protein